MNVWLWEAGSRRRVSNQERRAREAAAACLRGGRADVARVERALFVREGGWLTSGYQRTGEGLAGAARANGRISWTRLSAPAELSVVVIDPS